MERLRVRWRRIGRLGRLAVLAVVAVAVAVGYHVYEASTHWRFEVMGLDAHSGRVVWKRPAVLTVAGEITGSPSQVSVRGVVISHNGSTECRERKVTVTLDPATGMLVGGSHHSGGRPSEAPGSVAADGIEYRLLAAEVDATAPEVGANAPVTLQAIMHGSGRQLWRRRVGRRQNYDWTLSGSGDVAVVSNASQIWAFDRSGQLLWTLGDAGGKEWYHALIVGDRVIVTRDGWSSCPGE